MSDFLSAIAVALVAMPVAMALAVTIGLHPKHGIYASIITGSLVPLLGSSRWQVVGPTASFVAVLAPVVVEHGFRGVFWVGLFSGISVLFMGAFRVGRFAMYIPYPVINSFSAGVGVLLAALSIEDLLGLVPGEQSGSFLSALVMDFSLIRHVNVAAIFIGIMTLSILFIPRAIIKKVPNSIVAVMFGSLATLLMNKLMPGVLPDFQQIETIGSVFSFVGPSGEVVRGVPSMLPSFHLPTWATGQITSLPSLQELRDWVPPALAMTILTGIEALLSAKVADNLAGTTHDPNTELTAIGIGNIVAIMFFAVPATGATARTSTCFQSGAKTPLASSMHGVLVALFIMFLAPAVNVVPMPVLAAVLMNTAYRLSNIKGFLRIIYIAPKHDVFVLLLCFLLTVFVDVISGVLVGTIISSLLTMHYLAQSIDISTQQSALRAGEDATGGRKPLRLHDGIAYHSIDGPLFFGAAERLLGNGNFPDDLSRDVALDLRGIPFLDMSGIAAIAQLSSRYVKAGRYVHIVCTERRISSKLELEMGFLSGSGKFVRFYDVVCAAEVGDDL